MSWLAKSIANSLKLDDDDDDDDVYVDAAGEKVSGINPREEGDDHHQISTESPRGVKEDLSELTKTLTRQFWGVASFLAPPASASSHSPSSVSPPSVNASITERLDPSVSKQSDDSESAGSSPKVFGIRSDFAEIGGKFRTGISKLSGNMAVTEISKIASSFLPFGSEDSDDADLDRGAVGVTEEVLAFAKNISMHPETWLDFPLFVDDEDSDDFDMSDAQQEHALAVERLAPRLAALRIELCPRHMREGCFWKIYFVLLHPRLNKHDAELLSTPQIVEARAMLLQELQKRTRPKATNAESASGVSSPYAKDVPEEPRPISEIIPIRSTAFESTSSTIDFETEKHPVESAEMRIIDKSVVEEGPSSHTGLDYVDATSNQKDDDDGDDWLQDDNGEMGGEPVSLGNEEDVSFSDLEDDDDGSAPTSARTITDASDSSKGSRDWIQLSKNSRETAKDGHSGTKESNDWLSVDDVDVV